MGENATVMEMVAFVHLDIMDFYATVLVQLVHTVLDATVFAPVKMVAPVALSMENVHAPQALRVEIVRMDAPQGITANPATKPVPKLVLKVIAIVCLEIASADLGCSDHLAT